MFYRVAWTVFHGEEAIIHECIASLDDAWELWYWLTSRSKMEPEYRKWMMEQKKESSLFSPFCATRSIIVRVYDLEGNEVSPERGLPGMQQQKEA